MIRTASKVKIASGIAAGALALGAAGAYAANANNTITVTNPTPVTLGSGSNQLKLISLNGTTTLTAPTFNNAGQCVSWLAQNKNVALAPQGTLGSSVKLAKNYHGKLMSTANAWCKTQVTASAAKTDATETETPDAQESAAPETDATDAAKAGASHGQGHANHGHGHGKQTSATD